MRKPLVIFGAGGLGREILSLTRSLKDWEVIGFLDDEIKTGTRINGVVVLGDIQWLKKVENPINVIIAIGSPVSKSKIVKEIASLGQQQIMFPVIIHPSAILQDPQFIVLGQGTIITAGCVLTTNISLGDHVLINLNSTIGHDTVIGQCTSIMPSVNLAGEVHVGESVLIGSGACILSGKKIGDRSRVGMGAVVTHHVEPDITVVGIPARPVSL
jgi:sugar O-acyltransferase (sialic acid O-acetyltransferase NeuD family)